MNWLDEERIRGIVREEIKAAMEETAQKIKAHIEVIRESDRLLMTKSKSRKLTQRHHD